MVSFLEEQRAHNPVARQLLRQKLFSTQVRKKMRQPKCWQLSIQNKLGPKKKNPTLRFDFVSVSAENSS